MTSALEPDLAAAYVRELSNDVTAVLVLGPDGNHLAGPEAMVEPAQALLATLEEPAATLTTDAGTVWIARGPEQTLVATAGPSPITGPTALDLAAAAGIDTPSLGAATPAEPQRKAAQAVLNAVE